MSEKLGFYINDSPGLSTKKPELCLREISEAYMAFYYFDSEYEQEALRETTEFEQSVKYRKSQDTVAEIIGERRQSDLQTNSRNPGQYAVFETIAFMFSAAR